MLAILQHLKLDKYVEKGATAPQPQDKDKPTDAELRAIERWNEGEMNARTRIELAIGNLEMVHITGATTAAEIWNQLTLVKEPWSKLAIIATQ